MSSSRTQASAAGCYKLEASDGAPDDGFGYSVSLEGDTAVVGGHRDDVGAFENAGSAYVFKRSATDWSEHQKLTVAVGADEDDRFGSAVSLSGDRAVIGAPRFDEVEDINLGAAFVFRSGQAIGDACTLPGQCATNHCVDNVCCDTSCDALCEACSATKTGGTDGVCAPIAPGTDPDDDCPKDPDFPSSCGADGMCDGAGTCRANALSSEQCAPPSCSGETAHEAAYCDGVGSCQTPTTVQCAPYVCDVDACKGSCASDADCAGTFRCETQTGTCTQAPICNGHIVEGLGGEETDCSPYRCTSDGQCLGSCGANADCVPGFKCTSTGDCVPDAGTESDSGCSLAAPGRSRSGLLALALVCLPLVGIRRRLPRS